MPSGTALAVGSVDSNQLVKKRTLPASGATFGGWSFTEQTGTQKALVQVFTRGAGPLDCIAEIALSPGGSSSSAGIQEGQPLQHGLYVLVSGAVTGNVYHN